MAIKDLIAQLQSMEAPDRTIDKEIALVTGYRRKVDTSGGERNVTWFLGKDRLENQRLPKFTDNLDDAYELAGRLFPGVSGGVSWSSEYLATVNQCPTCTGKTPALALCAAVLTALLRKGG